MRGTMAAICVASVIMAGCSGDDRDTLHQQLVQVEAERDALQQEFAQVVAERDALTAQREAQTDRRDRAIGVLDEITVILDDPESFGTETEVADAIATHSTDSALMDDEVFGPMSYRDGFYNTLYSGGIDARLEVFHSWVGVDGSHGGVLWMWSGTNSRGRPFELVGVSLTSMRTV